jgi:hypothetical protein
METQYGLPLTRIIPLENMLYNSMYGGYPVSIKVPCSTETKLCPMRPPAVQRYSCIQQDLQQYKDAVVSIRISCRSRHSCIYKYLLQYLDIAVLY